MANGTSRSGIRVAALLMVALAIGACASDLQPRLQRCETILRSTDGQRRQQQWQLQQRLTRQQQQLGQLYASQQQSNDTIAGLQAALVQTQQQLAAERQRNHAAQNPQKPRPGVQIVNDIWAGTVSGAIDKALSGHQPQVEACYLSSIERESTSAGWMVVRFDVTAKGVTGVRLQSKKVTDRELLSCVIKAIGALAIKAPKQRWKVAQTLIFRLDRNVARTGDSPGNYAWPPVPGHMRAPSGGVCRAGSRRLDRGPQAPGAPAATEPLDPFVARPCEQGLTCCYGCGIPGCDATCMKVTNGCPRYP